MKLQSDEGSHAVFVLNVCLVVEISFASKKDSISFSFLLLKKVRNLEDTILLITEAYF